MLMSVGGSGGAPHAPWELTGESIIGLAWWRGGGVGGGVGGGAGDRSRLPEGLARLPGPFLVMAASYSSSPVGRYLELAVGEPARLGVRPGYCITTMVVDGVDARVGGILNWGFPKELGTLRWSAPSPRERELVWEERSLVVRGVAGRVTLPALVPVRALQHRTDGRVVVPGRLWGLARLARVTVDAPPDDPLAGLVGSHRGVVVGGMRFVIKPARHPIGLTATLRAPLQAPEPACTGVALPAMPAMPAMPAFWERAVG